MGGGQSNMLGNVAQQFGGAQIPAPPDRGQAMSAGQMRIPQMPQPMQAPMQPAMGGGGGKSGSMPGSNGMGRFGQFQGAYQPPAYRPAIFQPPQLAPVNQSLVMPSTGLLGSSPPGVDPDAWRYESTGG